jgi:hypothetical protein
LFSEFLTQDTSLRRAAHLRVARRNAGCRRRTGRHRPAGLVARSQDTRGAVRRIGAIESGGHERNPLDVVRTNFGTQLAKIASRTRLTASSRIPLMVPHALHRVRALSPMRPCSQALAARPGYVRIRLLHSSVRGTLAAGSFGFVRKSVDRSIPYDVGRA